LSILDNSWALRRQLDHMVALN